MMEDLTVLFLTCNELPKYWSNYHKEVLLKSIGEADLITISRKPLDFGLNLLQTEPRCLSNIYWQILKACKIATTKYIAIAEDDTLYPKEHFEHRPPDGYFAYNMSHWSLFTWGEPIYNWRNRWGNYSLVARREDVIEALEERYAKWPDGTPDRMTGEIGREKVERNLGLTRRNVEEFWTKVAVVNFNHDFASDLRQLNHRKRLGYIRALDIPFWGEAKELIKNFR
jgi:hypothetical protein